MADVNGGPTGAGESNDERLTPDMFSSEVGTSFRLVDEPGELELTSVTPLPAHGMRPDPFTLVFCAAGMPVLAQQIHRLEHDRLGALAIFLVPVGPDGEGRMRYEAVFN